MEKSPKSLGDQHVSTGEYHKALSLYTRSIESENDEKNKVELLQERSQVYIKVGLYDEALLDIHRALKITPTKELYKIEIEILKRQKKSEDLAILKKEIQHLFDSPDELDKIIDESIQELSTNPLCKITDELDCPLCLKVFFQPITTACGHTFCRECLSRSLDYAQKCPLCRDPIYSLAESQAVTLVINELVQKYKPEEYKERLSEERDKKSLNIQNLPFFVLDVVLSPGMTMALHIFEPRYRLMMRRACSGSKMFGMVFATYHEEDQELTFGNLAKIVELEQLPDGRSLIEIKGEQRFKVIEMWETDGYKCGKVELFDDEPEELNKELFESVEQQFLTYYNALNGTLQQDLIERFGEYPKGRPCEAIFWISNVICPGNGYKLLLWKMTSINARLEKLSSLIEDVKSRIRCNIQ